MKKSPSNDPKSLREAAEARWQEKLAAAPKQTDQDRHHLQHELEVHQIELEMQNEELRQAKSELDQALQRYTDLYDFAPVGYFNLAADGTIQMVNLTGASILGSERTVLIGQLFKSLVAQDDRIILNDFLPLVYTSDIAQTCEFKLKGTERKSRWVRLEASLSPDGKECRAMLIDITERKTQEEHLRHVQRMASIGTLSAGVAHDLNNTLTPISLSVGLLRRIIHDDAGQHILNRVEASATHGSEVVRQLLNFSHRSEGDYGQMQVDRVLKEMNALMHETFPRDILLEHDTSEGLRPILGNSTQLHQVLMNLCINARDAMPNGGRLSLTAENVELNGTTTVAHRLVKPGSYIAIAVTDTGEGIPPENLEQIFDPFFTTKVRERGTGLGLATCFTIVRDHSGFITVDSTVNVGTTFKVFIPAVEATSTPVIAPVPDEPTTQGHGELILVVDDEDMISDTLKLMLEFYDYRVLTANSGEEAIKLFRKHIDEVRLVMTDMMMPGMSGAELIRLLREQAPQLDIIAFTGLVNPEKREELKELGVDILLTKPCPEKELINAITKQLGASSG